MKNITLLSVILLTIGSVSAKAQTPFRRAAHSQSPVAVLKAKVARSMGKKAFTDIKAPNEQRIAATRLGTFAHKFAVAPEVAHLYKPQHQIEYVINEDTGEFEKTAEYTFTYTPDGEMATQIIDDGNVITKTVYTYDENNSVTSFLITESTDGGVTFTPTEKREQTYDSYFLNFTTEKNTYEWSDDNWVATGDAFKRTITRDADNNVTSVVISVPYDGQFEDTKRITNTFDPVTKEADTYCFDELGYNDDYTGFEWQNTDKLKNIKWFITNGQLVSDYAEWMEFGNFIKSATFVYDEDNTEVTGGYITIDYKGDENFSYKEVIDYSVNFPGKEVTTVTYSDDNSSIVYEHKYYEGAEEGVELTEDDVLEHEKSISTSDKYGNLTLEANYALNDEGTELEQTDGTRYDYTYDEEKGVEKEMVVNTYDYETGEYIPSFKIVTDAYVDVVTDGINSVKSNVNNNAPVEVYNLQGIRTNSATGKGVYIIRQGNVVKKVIK